MHECHRLPDPPLPSVPTASQPSVEVRSSFPVDLRSRSCAALLVLFLLPLTSLNAQPPTNGLVGYWPFNGNANDASGRGHHGIPGGAALVDDRFGIPQRAYYFDGNGDSIIVPDHIDFRFDTTESFTISLWVRTCEWDTVGGAVSWVPILDKSNSGGWGYGFYHTNTQVNSPSILVDYAAGPGESHNYGYIGAPRNDERWHHLAVVISDTVKIPFSSSRRWAGYYLDGQLSGSDEQHAASEVVSYRGITADITIGAYKGFSAVQQWCYKGAVDDIRIYNRALSATEVRALYSEGGWPDARRDSALNMRLRALGDTIICRGDSLQLSLSSRADTIVWDNLDGVSGENTGAPVVFPSRTTTYRVTGYRRFGAPCPVLDSQTVALTVVVSDPPIADAGAAQRGCQGDTITLAGRATGGTAPYEWEWVPADGLDNPRARQPRLVVNRSERYSLIVTDAKGCSDTADVIVSMISGPAVNVGLDTAYFCGGTAGIELVATGMNGTPPYTYSWQPRTGLDPVDGPIVTASPAEPTTYVVQIDDMTGSCPGFDTITVVPVDAPEVDAGPDVKACAGEAVLIGSPGPEGAIYAWSPATGLDDSTLAQPTARPAMTTAYRLLMTDTITGCTGEDDVLVTVRNIRLRSALDSIDFGLLDGCRNDSLIVLELFNDGADTATLETWSGTMPGVTVTGGRTIPGGESGQIRLRFAPSDIGRYVGTLTLRFAPCGDSIAIRLTGEKKEAGLSVEPGFADFGVMPACALAERDHRVVVTNNGSTDAEIGAAIVASPWSVVSPVLPQALASGDSMEIIVRYLPTGAGTFVGELGLPFAIGSCRDTLAVALRGIVEDAVLMAESDTVDFGTLTGCAGERDTVIVLVNSSPFDISVSGSSFPEGFVLLDPLPIIVPSNGVSVIRLRYAPGRSGSSDGMARLSYEPCGAELTISLRGNRQGAAFMLPDTLDFGELASCAGSTKSLPLTIRLDNGGMGDGQIASVAVAGPFTTDAAVGTILTDGAEREFTVTFMPTGTGTYTGELMLRLEPCDVERRVVLIGRFGTIEMTGVDLDFGPTALGTRRTGSVVFRNIGGVTMRVDRIDGVGSPFRLLRTTPALPVDLAPGAELHLEIEYAAIEGPSIGSVFAVTTSPCDSMFSAGVRGEGMTGARPVICLPELAAAPGENVRVELSVADSRDLDLVGARRFRAEVGFESSLLAVIDGRPSRVEGNERVVTIEGERETGSNVLAVVRLRAALGRVERTPLVLKSFEWLDEVGGVAPDTCNGEFELLGLCRDGGVRLYDPTGLVAIKSVTPNPANGTARIVYSLLENGDHRMRLVDLAGEEVMRLFSGNVLSGEYELTVDLAGLVGGHYYLILETPTIVLSEKVEVAR